MSIVIKLEHKDGALTRKYKLYLAKLSRAQTEILQEMRKTSTVCGENNSHIGANNSKTPALLKKIDEQGLKAIKYLRVYKPQAANAQKKIIELLENAIQALQQEERKK